MKKKWSTGKIVGVILGIIAAVIVLWVAFVISLVQLIAFLDKIGNDSRTAYESSDGYYEEDDHKEDIDQDDDAPYDKGNDRAADKDDDAFFYDYSSDEEYYDFSNDIKEDLDYQIEIKNYQRDDFIPVGEKSYINISFAYPVITGEVPNVDGINRAMYEEINIIEAHVASAAEFLSDGDIYDFTGTCYVTYMSDEILSVAYVEYGYLNDTFLESYVVSLNFDMQTGMILDNTNLLNINDDFSVDFRERCEKQNGEIEEMYYMSDQEITAYLTEKDYLIIFYTPLGMEIGFNYYDGWVTVTYKDFEQYKKHF